VNASVSPAPMPDRLTELPCQRDPDRWFDRRNRTHALTGCLACPARSWCARQALSDHATAGMWAGIWIDGDLAEAAPYLQAIADAAPPLATPAARRLCRTEPPRLPTVIRPPAEHTAVAAITARSSGHCEIMAADCLLTLDALASRIRGGCWRESRDAAAGYAVCQSCLAAVARMEPRLSHQLGYIVANSSNAAAVPFYWRQKHWMRFDSAGGAAPCMVAQRSA
jgi:hypothetical protein